MAEKWIRKHYWALTNLEHDDVVDNLGDGRAKREDEGLVPDGRVGGRTDVGLFDLPANRHPADRTDVVALQLAALDDAHFQLHGHTHRTYERQVKILRCAEDGSISTAATTQSLSSADNLPQNKASAKINKLTRELMNSYSGTWQKWRWWLICLVLY